MLLAAAAGAAARSRAKAGRRPPGSRVRRYREIFLSLSRPSRLRGVWPHRLRCADCWALDDPPADGLIWWLPPWACQLPARSAHSLALHQERLGETQRLRAVFAEDRLGRILRHVDATHAV